MLNEGILVNDTKILLKSAMMRELKRLGPTDPDIWERAVFRSLLGYRREEVNWEKEDNQAGYFLWIKSFDKMIVELIEDGFVESRIEENSGRKILSALESDPTIDISHLAYPSLAVG